MSLDNIGSQFVTRNSDPKKLGKFASYIALKLDSKNG